MLLLDSQYRTVDVEPFTPLLRTLIRRSLEEVSTTCGSRWVNHRDHA